VARVSIPLVDRKLVGAKAKGLSGPSLRAFDHDTRNIAEWKRGG